MVMKATAIAPANIAFIKYWGRKDAKLRLPYNASISMNLSACTTTTTVEFDKTLTEDHVTLLENGGFGEDEMKRVTRQLDVIRKKASRQIFARVATKNSFPKSTGAASSASGFAALTVAAVAALGLQHSEKELTILARLGSGSACRSIPDGFVKWEKGTDSPSSYAHSLYPQTYWDLRDILVIVGYTGKDVSSSAGHDTVETSPLFGKRLAGLPERLIRTEEGLRLKDLSILGPAIEADSLSMHDVMQTQSPPLFYWNDMTKTIMKAVVGWREGGLSVYFTIDAGPNVHLICEGKDEKEAVKAVLTINGVKEIIVNKPSAGAHLISSHLF